MRGAAVQVQALLRTLRSASEFQKRLQQHREAREPRLMRPWEPLSFDRAAERRIREG